MQSPVACQVPSFHADPLPYHSSKVNLNEVELKRSHQLLKEQLRLLHSTMKAAIAPRADGMRMIESNPHDGSPDLILGRAVFIDHSQASTSHGMQQLLVVVDGLSRGMTCTSCPPAPLAPLLPAIPALTIAIIVDGPFHPDPSEAARHAPGQTVDALFACSTELSEFLTVTCRDVRLVQALSLCVLLTVVELDVGLPMPARLRSLAGVQLEAAQVALTREKKLVRHQVEDEMRTERQAELAALRMQVRIRGDLFDEPLHARASFFSGLMLRT